MDEKRAVTAGFVDKDFVWEHNDLLMWGLAAGIALDRMVSGEFHEEIPFGWCWCFFGGVTDVTVPGVITD
jgi:hypothetical protein